MIKCAYKFLTSVFICFILLFIIGCNKNNYDQEINSLKEECSNKDKELENKTKELEELLKDLEDKEKELNDQNQEIENKTKEVEKLLKDLEDKEKELDEALYNNEINEEELSALKKAINELELLISQNNSVINDKQTQIDSLLTSNKLDSECINIISKILSTGVSLDEYLLFKENNQKVKGDEELKDLLDRIYYYYNKFNSINYFKSVINYDGLYFSKDTRYGYSHIVNIRIGEDTINSFDIELNQNFIKFVFYENSDELYFMIKELENTNNDFLKDKIVCSNMLIYAGEQFKKCFEENNVFANLKIYLDNLIQNNNYVDVETFLDSLAKIKDDYNYDYFIENYENNNNDDSYLIGINGKTIATLHYIDEEYNYNYFDFMFIYANNDKEREYSNMYFFGRLVIYIEINDRDNNKELIKQTYLYKLINEIGTNGSDLYKSININ